MVEAMILFLGFFVINHLDWKVKKWMKGSCPRGVMSCIGKYQRNLISMQTTKNLFFLEEIFFLLQSSFVAAVPQLERNISHKCIFLIYNGIYLLCFVCQLFIHMQIIRPTYIEILSLTSKSKDREFFETKLPKVLVPRREYVAETVFKAQPKQTRKVLQVRPWKGKGRGKGASNTSLPPIEEIDKLLIY